MSEMVERVARALCAESGHNPEGDYLWNFGRSHEIKKKNWEAYIGGARAAIEAMREPTEGMNRAAEMVGIDQDHRDYWAAMIDEALK